MDIKETLTQKQQQFADIVRRIQELDNMRQQLLTAGIEIQGQIKLLEEMLNADIQGAPDQA